MINFLFGAVPTVMYLNLLPASDGFKSLQAAAIKLFGEAVSGIVFP